MVFLPCFVVLLSVFLVESRTTGYLFSSIAVRRTTTSDLTSSRFLDGIVINGPDSLTECYDELLTEISLTCPENKVIHVDHLELRFDHQCYRSHHGYDYIFEKENPENEEEITPYYPLIKECEGAESCYIPYNDNDTQINKISIHIECISVARSRSLCPQVSSDEYIYSPVYLHTAGFLNLDVYPSDQSCACSVTSNVQNAELQVRMLYMDIEDKAYIYGYEETCVDYLLLFEQTDRLCGAGFGFGLRKYINLTLPQTIEFISDNSIEKRGVWFEISTLDPTVELHLQCSSQERNHLSTWQLTTAADTTEPTTTAAQTLIWTAYPTTAPATELTVRTPSSTVQDISSSTTREYTTATTRGPIIEPWYKTIEFTIGISATAGILALIVLIFIIVCIYRSCKKESSQAKYQTRAEDLSYSCIDDLPQTRSQPRDKNLRQPLPLVPTSSTQSAYLSPVYEDPQGNPINAGLPGSGLYYLEPDVQPQKPNQYSPPSETHDCYYSEINDAGPSNTQLDQPAVYEHVQQPGDNHAYEKLPADQRST